MKTLKFLPLVLIIGLITYSLGFNFFETALGPFRNVTIQEIQFKPNDSLVLGRDKSPILGDSVQIVSHVIAPPRVNIGGTFKSLLRGTSSWQCYVQDTANQLWGGMVVRQASRFTATNIETVDSGYVIRTKGYVQEFPATGFSNSLSQIQLDTLSSPIQIGIVNPSGSRPVPKLVNISEFAIGDYPFGGGYINYVGGEKYEGMYVEVRNVTVSSGIGNRQPWSVIDEQGNKLYMRDFSNFFSTQPTETLRTWSHPIIGTYVNYIRGVIINGNNTDAQFGTQLPYCIVPIYPNDLSIGNAPPLIQNYSRTPGVPTPPDTVTVTCTVTDPAFKPLGVASVNLFYRKNGTAYTQVQMSANGNIFSGKITPSALNTYVEYFIKATDSVGASKLYPSDTSKSRLFYIVKANDSLSIQEVQWCGNFSGRSGFENASVRGIEGICTADTSDLRAFSFSSSGGTQSSPRRVMLQNGTGPFSGIWITGNPTDIVKRGDRVRVRGTVEENYSVTRINVSTPADIQILSTGNTLPYVENLTTQVLANSKFDGDTTIEKWESVFVRFNTPVVISCANAGQYSACTSIEPLPDTAFRRNYGELLIRDFTGIDARIKLQDGNHTFTNNWNPLDTAGKTLLTKNDTITFVQGILYYSYSNYKLCPRRNFDFGEVKPVGISFKPEIVNSYILNQNYPNPFNPFTIINYSIPVNGYIKLNIYDISGREVAVLINKLQSAGTYEVKFDASGFVLSSGIYFYRLTADGIDGSKFTDTRRMVLIK